MLVLLLVLLINAGALKFSCFARHLVEGRLRFLSRVSWRLVNELLAVESFSSLGIALLCFLRHIAVRFLFIIALSLLRSPGPAVFSEVFLDVGKGYLGASPGVAPGSGPAHLSGAVSTRQDVFPLVALGEEIVHRLELLVWSCRRRIVVFWHSLDRCLSVHEIVKHEVHVLLVVGIQMPGGVEPRADPNGNVVLQSRFSRLIFFEILHSSNLVDLNLGSFLAEGTGSKLVVDIYILPDVH